MSRQRRVYPQGFSCIDINSSDISVFYLPAARQLRNNHPRDYERHVSTALADPEETELGRFFQQEISAHPGESGVALVTTGEWGFRACAGLSNQARRTIDVQYNIAYQSGKGHG